MTSLLSVSNRSLPQEGLLEFPCRIEIKAMVERNIPTLKTTLHLNSVLRLDTGEPLDKETLRDQNVAAFCGIAKPNDFFFHKHKKNHTIPH